MDDLYLKIRVVLLFKSSQTYQKWEEIGERGARMNEWCQHVVYCVLSLFLCVILSSTDDKT